jgi:hypothetical protein
LEREALGEEGTDLREYCFETKEFRKFRLRLNVSVLGSLRLNISVMGSLRLNIPF